MIACGVLAGAKNAAQAMVSMPANAPRGAARQHDDIARTDLDGAPPSVQIQCPGPVHMRISAPSVPAECDALGPWSQMLAVTARSALQAERIWLRTSCGPGFIVGKMGREGYGILAQRLRGPGKVCRIRSSSAYFHDH